MNKRTAACVFLQERVGLEPHRFQSLVLQLGGPEKVWSAPPLSLSKTGLFSEEQLRKLLKGRDERKAFERDLKELSRGGLDVVSCFDEDFPPGVLALSYPPAFLYRRGVEDPTQPHLLVAGASEAGADDITLAVAAGKALAALGVVAVSNLAEGLETAVHVGVLSGAGRHCVFLPCGHRATAAWDSATVIEQMSETGVFYSEYPPDTLPNATRRNEACRLAMGDAQGVLLLGRVDRHLETAVDAASALGRPVFYFTDGDSAEVEILRKVGAYPVPGTEHLERILTLL